MGKVTVIGIGFKPLNERAREALNAAGVVVTSGRLNEVFMRYPEYGPVSAKTRVIDNVDETMQFMHRAFETGTEEVALIASGDPLFYGIGRLAVREFGDEAVEIIPDISSIQYAFSRIKEPWDDALFISLHGGPRPEKRRRLKYEVDDVPFLLHQYDTIAILTDKEHNPTTVARALADAALPFPSLRLYVGERLGYDDERITAGTPSDIAAMTFDHPNVLIVKRGESAKPSAPPLPRFGLSEEEIGHTRGLITKDEVRAATLHALRLPEAGVLWDVGAGSGALSIEAARLSPWLQVYAIEEDEGQVEQIRKNIFAFGTTNVQVRHGQAPPVLSSLPVPDRVFVGGSGGRLEEIIRAASEVLGQGTIVVNAATLETLHEGLQGLEKYGFAVSVAEIWVARSKQLGGKRAMTGLNPVFVIRGEKR